MSTQIFGDIPTAPAGGTHAENLRRVRGNIEPLVVAFCRERLASGNPEFHIEDLTRYVRARGLSAPDSAGRILRALRNDGLVGYEVVNRQKSLYRVVAVLCE